MGPHPKRKKGPPEAKKVSKRRFFKNEGGAWGIGGSLRKKFNNFLEDNSQNEEVSREEKEESESEEEKLRASDQMNIRNVIGSKKDFLKNIRKLKEDVNAIFSGKKKNKENKSKNASNAKGKQQAGSKKDAKEYLFDFRGI
jgi:hypothetical protein